VSGDGEHPEGKDELEERGEVGDNDPSVTDEADEDDDLCPKGLPPKL